MERGSPLVYLIFGTPGSGRRLIVDDLAANGLGEGDKPVLLAAQGDEPRGAKIPVSGWSWKDKAIHGAIPAGATHVFLLADPRVNPVDQVESLLSWLGVNGAKIGRVFSVVDCQFGHAHPQLLPWFEACVHFSDVVFLTNTAGAPGSWITEFEKHFKGKYFPCLFERLSKGVVANPALVLETPALRMTPAFEDDFSLAGPPEYSTNFDDDEDDDAEDQEDEPLVDPYLARNRGGGNRVIEVPDITPFLPAAG